MDFTAVEMREIRAVDAGEKDYHALSSELQTKLYDYFLPEMPYGTAKARTGDPDQWICNHLCNLLNRSAYAAYLTWASAMDSN